MTTQDISNFFDKFETVIRKNAQILTALSIFGIAYVMSDLMYTFGQQKTEEWFTRGLKYSELWNAVDSTATLPLNDYRGRLYRIPVKRDTTTVYTFVGLNLPATSNCKIKRLFEQLTDVSLQAYNHLRTAREFMVQSFLCISMSSIFYTISIALLVYVTKSGWAATNPLIITILISTTAVASYFFGLTHIFKQEENANKNLALYIEHINIEQEMRSVLAREEYVQRNLNVNCANATAWLNRKDVHKADSLISHFNERIKQVNKIELGFDASGILKMRDDMGTMKTGN